MNVQGFFNPSLEFGVPVIKNRETCSGTRFATFFELFEILENMRGPIHKLNAHEYASRGSRRFHQHNKQYMLHR